MKLLRFLNHENIVPLLNVQKPDNKLALNDVYIITELMETDIVSFDKSDVVFQPPCLDKSDIVFQPPCLDKSVYIFQPTPDWKYYSSLYREIVYNESLWNPKC